MSTYERETKHPQTLEWERATWVDDALGHHHYGVRFPSEPEKLYDPETTILETRQTDGLEQHNGVHDTPRLERESVTYEIHHVIPCASASNDDEPHVCTNRDIKAKVTVHLPNGAVTLEKLDAPKNRYGNQNDAWIFKNSDPELVRAVGEMLIAAANASRNTLGGNV